MSKKKKEKFKPLYGRTLRNIEYNIAKFKEDIEKYECLIDEAHRGIEHLEELKRNNEYDEFEHY